MRFDNPIYDHGFEFPDIAEFPDVANEPRYNGNDAEEYLAKMRSAIENKNQGEFSNGYKHFMKKIDPKLFDKLNKMFSFYSGFKNNRKETGLPTNKIHDELFENGISYLHIDTDDLNKKLKSDINQMLDKADWRPPLGTFDRSKQMPEHVSYVNNMFNKLGILQAATKYNKGKPLQVKNVVLHIAKPTDQNYKQFLYDCETVSKTINTHIDPKEDVIKSMIYLNEIGEDDGPFKYIEQSQRWMHDDLQDLFGRAITTGSYCHDKESRASVFQLPKELRVSHNFGRLLLDGTPEQDFILDRQTSMTSDKANCCVFDTAGIHQGGVCNTGTRIALQVLMK